MAGTAWGSLWGSRDQNVFSGVPRSGMAAVVKAALSPPPPLTGRSLRSTWTDGRSRRLSVPATSRSDSDPNGLPGSHRGTSRTHRKLPHVHGGSLGGLGRGPLFGARRSGFDGPMQRPPVSLSQGAGGPSRQLCAWSTLWGGLEPGGVVGGRLGAPSGAPVCASRPDVVSVLPHHSFNVVGGTDLKSRRYETRNDFDF